MKHKFWTALLALAIGLSFGLAGCGKGGTEQGGKEPSDPSHEHNFIYTTVTSPTCTEPGKERGECSCGETDEREIPANGHTMIPQPAVASTCSFKGYSAYKKCEICGYSEGKTELDIDPTAHSYTVHKIDPWYDYTVCAYCGAADPASKREHVFENGAVKCSDCEYESPFQFSASSLVEGGLTLNGFRTGIDRAEITIPAEWYGMPVVEVGNFESDTLERVTIPSSVRALSNNAFYHCSKLTRVTFEGEGLQKIGGTAFIGCTSLTSLEMPDSVTEIGNGVFMDCSQLESVHLSSRLTSMGNSVFKNCSALTGAEIPDGVGKLGNEAFYECTLLQSVKVSADSQMQEIGGEAFYNCGALREIQISKNMKKFGTKAFTSCKNLQKVEFHGTAGDWAQIEFNTGMDYEYRCNPLLYAHDLYIGGGKVTNLVIPGTVDSIKPYAFCGCSATSITVEEGVKVIGNSAFTNMMYITSISLPVSLQELGGNLFTTSVSNYTAGFESLSGSLTNTMCNGVVEYAGTMAQWKAIAKDKNSETRIGGTSTSVYTTHWGLMCSVRCTNGTIAAADVDSRS